jgi:TPR repeat protein
MYQEARGVPRDEAAAVAAFKRACDGGGAHGCDLLGRTLAQGRGVTRDDDVEAAKLYDKACEAGDLLGCGDAGSMYVVEARDGHVTH